MFLLEFKELLNVHRPLPLLEILGFERLKKMEGLVEKAARVSL